MLRRIAVKAAHSELTKWEKPLGNTHLYRSIDQENGEIMNRPGGFAADFLQIRQAANVVLRSWRCFCANHYRLGFSPICRV